jgi:hypothetical protein
MTTRNLLEYSATAALVGVFFGMVAAAATGCVPHYEVPDPHIRPVRVPDGSCQAAGERLLELRCVGVQDGTVTVYRSLDEAPDGVPLWVTPGGEPFSEACQYAASQGRDWNPGCLAAVVSCGGSGGCLE